MNILHPVVIAVLMISLLMVPLAIPRGTASAQDTGAFIRLIRRFETKAVGIDHPGGLAYAKSADGFFILPAVKGNVTQPQANIFTLNPLLGLKGKASIAQAVDNPLNIAFDASRSRFLMFQSGRKKIIAANVLPDGKIDTVNVKAFDARGYNFIDVQGLAVDPATGRLFVLDASVPRIIEIRPNASGGLDWAATSQGGGIKDIPLTINQQGLRGLAFDPASGSLHMFSPGEQQLYEVTQAGQTIARRDLSGEELENPVGLAFAPTQDLTDDPARLSLYIAESRLDSGGTGTIAEFSFQPAPAPIAAAESLSLIRTIDTSRFNPPGPDVCGVEYVTAWNNLLIVDSEVEEMSIYQGVNLWRTTLAGSVVSTFDTTGFTNEPTGITYKASNGHFFFSADDDRAVYELNPGTDKTINTSDDVVTSFRTSGFGANDAEGIAYDSASNALFIVDGVNAEVYRIAPGSNGLFDGVGDVVTNFDTEVLGVTDPEGIAYNYQNGHLYIVGKPNTAVIETTTSGALVQTLDISAARATKPAGLGFGPSSTTPNVMSLYIPDRGVDNNTNASENDGKVYEVALDTAQPGNQPPMVSAGADQMVPLNTRATLDGTVADDGLPNPPGTVTTTWSKVSGPGTVSFASASAVDTTASFSVVGTYTLRLTANDSQLSAYDDTVITITDSTNLTTIETRVASGSDDAEEALSSGSTSLASGDLEVGLDGTSAQAVGLRFAQVNVPKGATIVNAYVQFKVDEVSTDATSVTVWGEASDNPLTFAAATKNVTSRAKTSASVAWAPAIWPSVGAASLDQRTPNLAAIIQQIVNRPGWTNGNAMALSIVAGSGRRTAEAYEGDTAGAPMLHIEYRAVVNTAPTVAITSPTEGMFYYQGATVTFTGTATDTQDGSLTNSLVWTSSRDGQIGTGGGFTKNNLSIGTHTITATVVDSGGMTNAKTVSIEVRANTAPQIAITSPATGSKFTQGNPITFTGTASDTQDGSLSSSIVWSSNLSGPIGIGASVASSTLSEGTHTITATVTDSGNLSSFATIVIEVLAPNTPPTVTITSPVTGATFLQGSPVTFTGSASDTQDGNLSAAIVWSSSINNTIGTGASVSTSALSIGTHTITATVTDKGGQSSPPVTISIEIRDPNTAPVVTITSPASGSRPLQGQPVTFTATAADAQDGDLSASLTWTSDKDQQIGTGASFTKSDLSVNTHTITASVKDAGGKTGSAQITLTIRSSVNLAPVVNAGPDQSVTRSAGAVLDGTVSDDGLPEPSALTTTWSKASGPGTVTFANPAAVDTSASFSAAGTYTLRLTANDGLLSTFDEIIITVSDYTAPVVLEKRVASGSDDSEEVLSNGTIDLTSSDLEFGADGTRLQLVGMRFNQLAIPQGAVITNAYLQFQVDEISTAATSLTIWAEAADNPPAFSATAKDITARPKTAASVPWTPVSWPTVGAAGADQRTPNLAPVLQPLVDRPGWASGNSMVLLIAGSGRRTAEAFEGVPAAAPLLHVEYQVPVANYAPSITITHPANGATFPQGSTVTFTGSAQDTEDGDLTASLTWTSAQDGPLGTGGTFTKANLPVGTHTITASATDSGGKIGSATVTIEITDSNTAPVVTITSPASGSRPLQGQPVTFTATAADAQDGDLSASLTWTSDKDQQIGTGASFTKSDLSVNTHTITASVTDKGGKTGSAQITLTIRSSVNLPPVVNAGPDQSVTRSAGAVLDGTVSDDGLPEPPALTTMWSKTSGPGTVTFANPAAVDTSASFSAAGTYTLRLTANDGLLATFDEIIITVTDYTAPVVLEKRVASGSDDSEEVLSNGTIDLTSSDLEFGADGTRLQLVGMRFNQLSIPPGAVITNAYLQFQVDEISTAATSLTIWAEAADNPPAFSATAKDITARPKTAAAVPWTPASWPTVGAAGVDQRTPNLAPVLQPLVDRPGWASGNSMVLLIAGSGRRTAEAFEGVPAAAPLLHIEYAVPAVNTQPVITIHGPAAGASFVAGTPVAFSASAFDAQDGDLTANLVWRFVLGDPVGTGGSFSRSDLPAGERTIAVSVTDSGGLTGSASLTINITANTPPTVAITGPADHAVFTEGDSVTFTGSVTDPEENSLGESLVWTSTIDDQIGTGSSFAKTDLSVGIHTITASVKDQGGLADTDTVTIEVKAKNTPPTVTITAPAAGASFTEGDPVIFTASVTDAQDSDLASAVTWRAGSEALGTGASITVSALPAGPHTITASVTDKGGLTGDATVTIEIKPNDRPVVTISRPSNDAWFAEGTAIQFAGSASDAQDGPITTLVWTYDDAVPLGSGSGFTQVLPVGKHTVTASATDKGGLTGTAQITITVNPNQPPVVTITGPADGATFVQGEEILLRGVGKDPEEGALIDNLLWKSSIDGEIGSGTNLRTSSLSYGTHTITASVTDKGGLTDEAQITITVVKVAGPDADAAVDSSAPDRNVGADPTLTIQTAEGQTARAFLKFTVSGAEKPVQSVKLRLFATADAPAGAALYLIPNTEWAEDALTWNNAPALPADAVPLATAGAVSANQWVAFDVTAAVSGNGTYTFVLVSGEAAPASFHSKEAAENRPQLAIQ